MFFDFLKNNLLISISCVVLLALIIYLLWKNRDINGNFKYYKWKKIQDTINAYINNGFSRKEAIQTIQDNINTKAKNRALNGIASSVYFNNRPYHRYYW